MKKERKMEDMFLCDVRLFKALASCRVPLVTSAGIGMLFYEIGKFCLTHRMGKFCTLKSLYTLVGKHGPK